MSAGQVAACRCDVLNLFFKTPEADLWLPLVRHPRKLIGRFVRGGPRPGGQKRAFFNLCAALERLGHPFLSYMTTSHATPRPRSVTFCDFSALTTALVSHSHTATIKQRIPRI